MHFQGDGSEGNERERQKQREEAASEQKKPGKEIEKGDMVKAKRGGRKRRND